MKITFGIITLNEESNLKRCLMSIGSVADEIVIVDSGSTDNSKRVAESFGARWIEIPWKGYVAQKNNVLSHSRHPWVFSIDADEALSPALIREIMTLKSAGHMLAEVSGYSMPRCVLYENRWIRNGDWYPDRLVRLFQKAHAEFVGGRVHERLQISGKISELAGEIEHHSFTSRADHWDRCCRYAALWAQDKFEAGKSCNRISAYSHAAFRWIRGYLFRGGFLDGKQGLQIANLCAREVFLKYSLLEDLQAGKAQKNVDRHVGQSSA